MKWCTLNAGFGSFFEEVLFMIRIVLPLLIMLLLTETSSCIFAIRDDDKKNDKLTNLDAATADSVAIYDTNWHQGDTSLNTTLLEKDTLPTTFHAGIINTKNIHPNEIISFAKTLIGVPYQYASTDPKIGFDCSGFITYVFHHFEIQVPRSSIDFTNVGTSIPVEQSKPGDLILFTGTDSTEHFVGHMGIIISNADTTRFIHSTSGKANGVTITPLNNYYKSRYVKTIRIFKQNDR